MGLRTPSTGVAHRVLELQNSISASSNGNTCVAVQLVTAGPVLYSIIINGASQIGGRTGTALLPLFDLMNHDSRSEVCQCLSFLSQLYTV